jgi:hypothetical protein
MEGRRRFRADSGTLTKLRKSLGPGFRRDEREWERGLGVGRLGLPQFPGAAMPVGWKLAAAVAFSQP